MTASYLAMTSGDTAVSAVLAHIVWQLYHRPSVACGPAKSVRWHRSIRRQSQRGKHFFRQCESTEKDSRVQRVATQSVPEDRHARHKTSRQACGGFRIIAAKRPHGKIRDNKELCRAEEHGSANSC